MYFVAEEGNDMTGFRGYEKGFERACYNNVLQQREDWLASPSAKSLSMTPAPSTPKEFSRITYIGEAAAAHESSLARCCAEEANRSCNG